jgi:hypothetical protein
MAQARIEDIVDREVDSLDVGVLLLAVNLGCCGAYIRSRDRL